MSEVQKTVIPSIDDVKSLVEYALDHFCRNDSSLMDYKTEVEAVSERCMVFRIGWYIQNYMNKNTKWSTFDLDAEYNRCFDHPKSMYKQTLDGIKSKIGDAVPDLLIHKRRTNSMNMVVFEFKKAGAYEEARRSVDYQKLKYFTDTHNEYKYKYGLWIELYKTKKAEIHILTEGEEQAYTWNYKRMVGH